LILAGFYCISAVMLVQTCMTRFCFENKIWTILSNYSLETYLIHKIFIHIFHGSPIRIEDDSLWIIAVTISSILFAVIIRKLNSCLFKHIISRKCNAKLTS
jgi:peptidoglycan/LPS O-acetylase OafA/YrhL